MRIYIAGLMRGYHLLNWPAFDAASERLRAAGHDPVNPADLDRAEGYREQSFEAIRYTMGGRLLFGDGRCWRATTTEAV